MSSRYKKLQQTALDAGFTGRLTQHSPARLTREQFLQRPIFGAAPALAATAPIQFVDSFYESYGLPGLVEAAQRGGAIIVGTHVGSLGITPALLVRRGLRVLILRDQQFAPLLNTPHGRQFFLGAEPIFLDLNQPDSVNRAMIRCAKALRQGAVIAYTADARHGSHFRTGTVLGQTVQLRTALVELAIRCNSAVVSAFSHYDSTKIMIKISEPQWLKETEIDEWCENFCTRWESQILHHPETISWHIADLDLIGVSKMN